MIEICKCGHEKLEHNPPSNWEDNEDTFCFHKDCSCEEFSLETFSEVSDEQSKNRVG